MNRETIISTPEYWVEELNGKIYNAISRFMESRSYNQKDMANYLNISQGRMSQILNSGDINFSYEKIINIILKLDLVPSFDLESRSEFLKKELHEYAYHKGLNGSIPVRSNDLKELNVRKLKPMIVKKSEEDNLYPSAA